MTSSSLAAIYQRLLAFFGPQHWWPGESALEITVGAVLTQNTAWGNVEKAIANLRGFDLLPRPAAASGQDQDWPPSGPPGPNEEQCLAALAELPPEILAAHIRPAGYYNLKAQRLRNLLHHVHREYGTLADFLALPVNELRRQLLGVKGIGPETADSIILYAANQPVFVVDAYTHRIFSRHQLLPEETDYHAIQEAFTDALPADPQLYNEYHALIVRTGKEFCRKTNPRCDRCPLGPLLT